MWRSSRRQRPLAARLAPRPQTWAQNADHSRGRKKHTPFWVRDKPESRSSGYSPTEITFRLQPLDEVDGEHCDNEKEVKKSCGSRTSCAKVCPLAHRRRTQFHRDRKFTDANYKCHTRGSIQGMSKVKCMISPSKGNQHTTYNTGCIQQRSSSVILLIQMIRGHCAPSGTRGRVPLPLRRHGDLK